MPQGDQTGPEGRGPRTGRGLGFCNGYPVPGFMNPSFGRGFGRGIRRDFYWIYRRGMGRGFGWRRRAFAPITPVEQVIPIQQEPTKEQEKQLLQQELKEIEAETKDIETEKQEIIKRLKTLK